ncbi:cysteine desulfurase family protein [uncultured Mitsuokella sp.]|uniref:cysteine desulfurase family protein n=1 Tax=uncultured Mitsuokella sp. TaxID=453120 RepID=UPI002592B33E|nr:cysteine desulfurase family protein [uncultured Mitsuokella sp.]
MKPVYLDYAATTPVDARVVQKMLPYFCEQFGNPSSLYAAGRAARQAVSQARRQLAALLDAEPDEIFFTSGGSESDNWVIRSLAEEALRHGGGHIITTKVEHHAVRHACEALPQGIEVTYLDVDAEGRVRPEQVEEALRPDTFLVTVMTANNEVGTIEPIPAIGALCRARGVFFHTDAVQAVGHIPVSVKDWQVDALSLSGHKLYGPKGVGALYLRRGHKLAPLIYGGAQERGLRAGTENTAGIVGLGFAAAIAAAELHEESGRLQALRDHLFALLQEIPGVRLNGAQDNRLPGNLNVAIEGVDHETLLIRLDLMGFAVSAGSACSAGSLEPSHVLTAMGQTPEQASTAIRVTLGRFTTEEEVEAFAKALRQAAHDIRRQAV